MGEVSSPTGVNGGDIDWEGHSFPSFTTKSMHPPPALLIFLSPLPIFQHMDPNPCTVDWVCCPCTKAMLGSGKGGECQLALGHEKTTHIHFPVKLALNKPDVSKHGSADCTNTPESRVILGRCEQGCARRVKEKATQHGRGAVASGAGPFSWVGCRRQRLRASPNPPPCALFGPDSAQIPHGVCWGGDHLGRARSGHGLLVVDVCYPQGLS